MSAVNISAAQLQGTLGAASLSGALSAGSVVVNDYMLSMSEIDGGHRLTITRGSEVQTLDIMDGVGIAGIEKTESIGNVDVYTITMTDGSSYTFTVTNGSGEGVAPGTDGGHYTPSVSDAGDLSWAASKSGMPAVDTVNIKGPQGPQGEPGQDAPQDVVCYTAQSLDPDQQAQARKNIAAAGAEDLNALNDNVSKFPVIKSGVVSILFPTGSKSVSQDIVFDEKMVDTNYAIVLNADGGNGNYRFFTQYTNKLQSGFRAYLISDNNTALSADRTVEVSWLAIR